MNANISALKAEIETNILAHGESVKGEKIHAIWSKGKASHSDTPKTGYFQVTMYRKEGTPTVSFKPVK